jgi:L-fucose mutarotase
MAFQSRLGYHRILWTTRRDFWKDTSMLKNIPPVLSPELMDVLMRMGHGDELVIADGNYPSEANAKRLVRADGHGATAILEAVLQFLPLDTFVEFPATVMQPVDAASEGKSASAPPIWSDFRKRIESAEGRVIELHRIERFAFYERSRKAYAIVATGETAIYANVILTKGVVYPAE